MNALSNHLGKFFIADRAAYRRLNVIACYSSFDDISRCPPDKLFAAFSAQIGKKLATISRNTASLDPVLDSLIGNTHLPRHVGNRVEFRDGSLECWVLLHGSCQRLLNLKTILAQAPLVSQETFQLPQALPVEILGP